MAFSRVESAVMPFEERERMEGEHTPEKDLTRHPQVLEEGDQFESSILRLDKCFLSFLRVDTHLLRAFWNALRLPLVRLGISLLGREGKLFQSNCLTTGFSVP